MKQQLNLSYKRINSRPLNVDFERLLISRILFSLHFSKIINNDLLLINIDESWLNKATKANYSWVSTGKNSETQNINLKNTMNIVFVICSMEAGSKFCQRYIECWLICRFIGEHKNMARWT